MNTQSSEAPPRRKLVALRAMAGCILCMGVVSNFTDMAFTPDSSNVSQSPALRGTAELQEDDHDEVSSNATKLDFFVAGFPKCGTTTLLKTFEMHQDTLVAPKEECSLAKVDDDEEAYASLMTALNGTTGPHVKRGIKCPFGLSNQRAIERLEEWYPDVKLIFGLRHPVMYFQSFYNYRVLMVHQGKLEGPIPPAETLIGSKDWARVSTGTAQYDLVLRQLGKTNDPDIKRTPFKVMLYTLEQMEDDDEVRSANLRKTLGSFLELKHDIEPLEAANVNTAVGKDGFKETIDICDERYDGIRNILVENGKEAQRWIREEFVKSPDVTVANADHFDELLKKWAFDPCEDPTAAQRRRTRK